ncbi:hypothetical protein BH09PAT2_BH09PAT2_06180 [soil metagenome]
MKNKKSILLLILIFILAGGALYITFLIQNGGDPLAVLNSRASGEQPTLDEELDTLLSQVDGTVTPTVGYNSTSPSPSPTNIPGGATSPNLTATPSAALTPTVMLTSTLSPTIKLTVSPSPLLTMTPTPTYIQYVTATPLPTLTVVSEPMPTAVTSLPVAGLADQIPKFLIGGGVLVLVSMFL